MPQSEDRRSSIVFRIPGRERQPGGDLIGAHLADASDIATTQLLEAIQYRKRDRGV